MKAFSSLPYSALLARGTAAGRALRSAKRVVGLSLVTLFLAASASGAEKPASKPAAPKPADQPVLAIVISDNLQSHGSASDDYNRLDYAFRQVVEKRSWPVKLTVERFAAGVPDFETEVRIFCQPIRHEVPDELVFRAWVSVYANGKKKHDFAIVTYRFYPRMGENRYDVYDKLFLGFANAAADKLAPVLFPKAGQPAPAKP